MWLVRACPRKSVDFVRRVQEGWWHPGKGFLAHDKIPFPVGRAGNSWSRASQGEREASSRDNKACQSIRVCGVEGEVWKG